MLSLFYGQCGNQIGMFQTANDAVDVPVAAQQQVFQAPWTGIWKMGDGPVGIRPRLGFFQNRFDNSRFHHKLVCPPRCALDRAV